MHIARVGERLPRLQIQFRISRSFRPRNLANLGSKIRFWIRRKELKSVLSEIMDNRSSLSIVIVIVIVIVFLLSMLRSKG